MRIMYWGGFWPNVGGVETHTMRLLPALKAIGHDCHVVAPHRGLDLPDEATYQGIPVHRFPFLTALASRDVGLVARLRQAVAALKREVQPDLVHLYLNDPTYYFHLLTASAHPVATVVTINQEYRTCDAQEETLLGRILRSAEKVTAISNALLADTLALMPDLASRSSLIYLGLDPPALPPTPLPFAPARLLCIGRLVPDKGFDLAIDALPGVLARYPETRLVVASDGPERSALEQQVKRMGLAHAVEFTGWVEADRLPALYNSATAVVVPSRWREGFGLVALEASRMARPVVATSKGGLTEIVAHEETGLLVEGENPKALADALLSLLADRERAVQMGQAARSRAITLFPFRHTVEAYDALYQRLGLWQNCAPRQAPPQMRS